MAAANPFALPARSPLPTTSFSLTSSSPSSALLRLCNFSLRQKSGKTRLLLGFRCCALTTTCDPSSTAVTDSSTMLFPLFQELGLNEKQTESIMGTNPSLKTTHFESICSRVHSLQSSGITPIALSKLILKQPLVLTSQEVETLLSFISKEKIKLSQIEHLLKASDPEILVGFEEKVRLLVQFGITEENLTHVLNNVNLTRALCLKTLEEIERTLSFLQRFGGVELIVRRPAVLNYDLESQLIPRIGFLLDLSGGDENAMGVILRKFPSILAYTVDHLNDHVEFFNSYAGLSYEEIFSIILVHPSLFSASRKRKIQPRIDFLKNCELSPNDIFRFLIKAPLFLSLSFEANLGTKLVFLVKIGYENGTRELALAMGAVTRCSCKNLQEVIGVFLNYGLSCQDIFDMSKKHPQVLQYNHESLEEKMDYLIGEMGREVDELLSFPAFLGYKLEERIKPRFEEKRKVMGEGMSINKLLSVSAASFSKKGIKEEVTSESGC